MTANQWIAMLFPVGTAFAVALTGLLVKKVWVDRPAEDADFVVTGDNAVIDIEVEELISTVDRRLEQAHLDLQEAKRNLSERLRQRHPS